MGYIQESATRVRHDLETKPPTTTTKSNPQLGFLCSEPPWLDTEILISPSWLISKHFLPSTGKADALSLILLRPQDLWAVQGLLIGSTRIHRHPCSLFLCHISIHFCGAARDPGGGAMRPLLSVLSDFSQIHLGSHVCGRVKLLHLCPTLCDSMDYSPPGSSVYGILQIRILE